MPSQETALLNNWLKVVVLANGHLALKDIKRDKETGNKIESVIAIYSDQLNLLSDMTSLLIKRAIYFKQITSFDDCSKLTAEFGAACRTELEKLKA
ncbi:DUF5405 family protein [Klebsiella aerogenes]|nr:DUF5405 family protein [Klebsiella aerogenes]